MKKNYNFTVKQQSEDDNCFTIKGLASTHAKDLHNDIIMPGAFTESLSKRMPVILYQHNQREPIGVAKCWEVEDGLMLEGALPKDDSLVKGRIMPQINAGSLRGLSVGMYVDSSDVKYDDQKDAYLIGKAELYEVSLVTFPANEGAYLTDCSKMSCKDLHNIATINKYDKMCKHIDKAIAELGA